MDSPRISRNADRAMSGDGIVREQPSNLMVSKVAREGFLPALPLCFQRVKISGNESYAHTDPMACSQS